jgi:hypothetical protein
MTKGLCPLLIIFLVSCSRIDLCIHQGGISKKPDKILIGYFEKRILEFDPYIEKNFRDALRFDLFKRGYRTELLSLPVTDKSEKGISAYNLSSQKISEFNLRHSSDLFIQGIISERSYGDAIETKTSTLVLLFLYNSEGKRIGEARYIASDTLASAETILRVSSTLVGRLDSVLSN